jgi:hypothetical protein
MENPGGSVDSSAAGWVSIIVLPRFDTNDKRISAPGPPGCGFAPDILISGPIVPVPFPLTSSEKVAHFSNLN